MAPGRLEAPILEALHQTHLLTQIGLNFVFGQNQPSAREAADFKHQVLKRRRKDGSVSHLSTFLRLEFQDGSRRPAQHSYHGSGRPHAHQLVLPSKGTRAEDLEAMRLEQSMSASLSLANEALRGYAQASQAGGAERSRFPVQEEPSYYDQAAGEYRFQHTEGDRAQGVRGFFVAALEATKWHQDVQVDQQGERNYASYLAKYASKFSDSVYEELLEGDAEANTLAASVLSRYRPAVPEMLLQLFGTAFRQWHVSTWSRGRKDFRPPAPDDEAIPVEVQAYMNSTWRKDNMSLLEFLRKSNDQGQISGWVKEKWKLAETALSLEDFANAVPMDGEKIVACEMGSRLKDRFYGQWLVLFVPFRSLADFHLEDVAARVPKTDKYLAACVACPHPVAQAMWQDSEALEEELRVEGHGAVHRRMVRDYVRTQTEVLKQYLSGRRAVPQAPERPADLRGRVVHLSIRQKYADLIVAGAKTVEGRLNQGAASTVKAGDLVQFGPSCRARVGWVQQYSSFRAMLEDVGYRSAVPEATSLHAASKVYLTFPRYQELEARCGVVALGISPEWAELSLDQNVEQRRWQRLVEEDLERTLWARMAAETQDFDDAREACWAENKIRVLEGPPGTGKTTTAKAAVEAAAQQGAQVLWTGYTAQLAARARAVLPEAVTVDTCHAALGTWIFWSAST